MITDKLNMFSEDQADVRNIAAYLSTKSIDLGLAKGIRVKNPLSVYAKTGAAAFAGTNGTLKVEIVSATDAALTGSLTVLHASDLIPVASLTANTVFFKQKLPQVINQRYIGLRYTVATTNMTGGLITAGLTDTIPTGSF